MKVGSRKFVVAMTALLGGIALGFVGKLTGGEFVTIATVCVAAFSAANTFEHKFNGQKSSPGATS